MVAIPIAHSLRRHHVVQWRTASALWRSQQPRASFQQPAILRFTSDRFMEQFMEIAAQAPQRLGEWRVQPENWRQLAPIPSLRSAPSEPLPLPDEPPVKLYQPAHERYYLVTASLVCRQPGLPDKSLNLGQKEKVSFVVRRMLSLEGEETQTEHAWVDGGWQPAESPSQLAPGEETLPMFPTTYREPEGHRRRLFAGLVPVTERERYLTAPRRSVPANPDALPDIDDKIDRLVTLFNIEVLAPWRELLNQVGIPFPDPDANPPETRTLGTATAPIQESLDEGVPRSELKTTVKLQQNQFQLSSWYALLDFAEFLDAYLPRVWQAVRVNDSSILPAGSDQRTLFDTLTGDDARFWPRVDNSDFELDNGAHFFELLTGRGAGTGVVTLWQAMNAVKTAEEFLETDTQNYPAGSGWPSQQFLLCGQAVRKLVSLLDDSYNPATGEQIDTGLIHKALAEETATATRALPQTPLAREVSRSARESDVAENQFVIRCVYERPNCPASLHPTVVSEPTARFLLAAYYDPDAPARPIRIPMPLDTTPAGLRKYAKNTMFVISDTLGCQIERAKSITFGDLVRSVLPWPFHKDFDTGKAGCSAKGSLDFGKLCTLSIPIITICALIILIIFVLLLDIIFRWVPYLIFCLPIPGLKAKGENK